MTEEQFRTPLPVPDSDSVFRQCFKLNLKPIPGSDSRRFPSDSHFIPDTDGLSVNWDAYCTIDSVYHIIGLTFKHKKETFKNPKDFGLFKIPVAFVRAIENVIDVKHSPVYNGNPASVGNPNNYAHASLIYPDDEEIRLKLSDFCKENHDGSYCEGDFSLLEPEIEDLRKRLNDTPYHRV